ncbi:MAG: hypothetical protein HY660_00325 [Armatimonadetes bacterium]|nr:hypothetical protein [Armatimonadota bacterium]
MRPGTATLARREPTGELPEHLLEHVVGGTSPEALMVRLAEPGLLPDTKNR